MTGSTNKGGYTFYAILASLLLLGALVCGFVGLQGRQKAEIQVEWSTASEMNTAGFHLYRAESPDGPFTRITTELIPASPDPLTGGDYSFSDRGVVPGRTYYYQLEEIELDGGGSRAGPVEVKAEAETSFWLPLAALLLFIAILTAVQARSLLKMPVLSAAPEVE